MLKSAHIEPGPIKRIPNGENRKPSRKIFAILNDIEKKLERDKIVSPLTDFKTVYGSICS